MFVLARQYFAARHGHDTQHTSPSTVIQGQPSSLLVTVTLFFFQRSFPLQKEGWVVCDQVITKSLSNDGAFI